MVITLKTTKQLLLAICLLGATGLATAQSLRSAYVLTEDDDADNTTCGVSNTFLKSAAESALRYNRIDIASSPVSNTVVYVQSNVMPLSASAASCAATVRVEFKRYGEVLLPQVAKRFHGDLIVCSRSSLFAYSRQRLQQAMIDATRNYIDHCISEIEKK